MDENRTGIIKEVVVVLVLVVLLLAAGGLLVRNVVVGIRSLEAGQADPAPAFGELEKLFRDITSRFAKENRPSTPSVPAPSAETKVPAAGKKAEVTQVRFYEAGGQNLAVKDRVYSEKLGKQARYIYTEVSYKNNNYQVKDSQIAVAVQYYNAAGQVIYESSGTIKPSKDQAASSFTARGGKGDPGTWSAGRYTVKILLDREQVGDYNFTIE